MSNSLTDIIYSQTLSQHKHKCMFPLTMKCQTLRFPNIMLSMSNKCVNTHAWIDVFCCVVCCFVFAIQLDSFTPGELSQWIMDTNHLLSLNLLSACPWTYDYYFRQKYIFVTQKSINQPKYSVETLFVQQIRKKTFTQPYNG